MLKRFLFILVMLSILLLPQFASAAHVPSAWALKDVHAAIELGFVPADLQSDYDRPITRAEFCKAAVAFIAFKTGDTMENICARMHAEIDYAVFSDTSDQYVAQIAALGIVGGVGDGTFQPERFITRQEAATILRKIVTSLDLSVLIDENTIKVAQPVLYPYADDRDIDDWARENVYFISGVLGSRIQHINKAQELATYNSPSYPVMQGNEKHQFDPKGQYTREQTYVTLLRLANATHYNAGRRLDAPDGEMKYSPPATHEIHFSENRTSNPVYHLFETRKGYTWLSYTIDRAIGGSNAGTIRVYETDKDWNLTRSFVLPEELVRFGTAYLATDGNFYVLTGRSFDNEEGRKEPDDAEAVRVVKYDQNWNRLGSVSIPRNARHYVGKIVTMFDLPHSDMADNGTLLTVNTNGNGTTAAAGTHQSNRVYQIDMETMTLVFPATAVFDGERWVQPDGSRKPPIVSHSFWQGVVWDGAFFTYVNYAHGGGRDGMIIETDRSSDPYYGSISSSQGGNQSFRIAPTLNIYNMTPGGFDASGSHFMLTVSSIGFDNWHGMSAPRNAYLLVIPKGAVVENQARTIQLTDYPTYPDVDLETNLRDVAISVGAPRIVRITNDRLCILWNEYRITGVGALTAEYVATKYLVVDGEGNRLSETMRSNMPLDNEVQPIYSDGKILWITSAPVSTRLELTQTGSNYFLESGLIYAPHLATIDLTGLGVDLAATTAEYSLEDSWHRHVPLPRDLQWESRDPDYISQVTNWQGKDLEWLLTYDFIYVGDVYGLTAQEAVKVLEARGYEVVVNESKLESLPADKFPPAMCQFFEEGRVYEVGTMMKLNIDTTTNLPAYSILQAGGKRIGIFIGPQN